MMLPQVVCSKCANHSTAGLTPSEAAEVCRCLVLNELRHKGWVRHCRMYIELKPHTIEQLPIKLNRSQDNGT